MHIEVNQLPPPRRSQKDNSVVCPEDHRNTKAGVAKSALKVRESFTRAKIRINLCPQESTSGRDNCVGKSLEVWNLTRCLL